MHVLGIQAENFKRLKLVDVEIEGNQVIIGGQNAQGKSSLLDAIFATLGGKAGVKDIPRPIRDGEDKAHVTITLDELVVTRRWSGSTSRIEVKARDGKAKFTSPQKVLDSLIGKLSFDPLAFAEADQKSQLAMLKNVVELDVDLDDLAAQRRAFYDERTVVNRDVKRLAAVVDEYDGPTKVPDVDTAWTLLEVRALQDRKAARDRLLEEHERNQAEIARLQARQQAIVEQGRQIEVVTDEQIEAAESAHYEAVQAEAKSHLVARYHSDKAELEAAEKESKRLTRQIEIADATRVEALSKAKFPVEGLAFDEDGVLWQGVPLAQASSAERIRVSVAMAMALNPELRVILIENASLLDSDAFATIQALADERDYQIWYEVVGEHDDATVIIEDGEVRT